MRFKIALSFGNRNSLGAGLPGWPAAVTVPNSAYPNPIVCHTSANRPFLSKPAANPNGCGNTVPNTSCDKIGSFTCTIFPTSRLTGRGAACNTRRAAEIMPWIRSGDSRNMPFNARA